MKEYIGTKIVQAYPAYRYTMLSGCYVFVPHDEDNPQMLGATACEDGYQVIYQDGYKSWSPKAVFEAAYRETSGMTNIDRILSGDKEMLVSEICDIAVWVRGMTKQDWYNITHDSDGGLSGVIRRCLEGPKTSTAAE